jgi:ACR3 family arsenite transporter
VEEMRNMSRTLKLAEHMRKYLLLYVFIVIAIAFPLGYYLAPMLKANASIVKLVILGLAITTLYPSMIQLKIEKLSSETRYKLKELLVGLTLIFIITPLLAIWLANYLGNKYIGIGFVAANAVPASSASIAYVLIAEGNIELATVLAVISILGAIILAPLYISLYASTVSIHIPITILAESVTIALITPLVLGQITRYYLVKRRARKVLRDKNSRYPCKEIPRGLDGIEDLFKYLEDALECIEGRISRAIKPYLSLATMISMLLLIAMLIMFKAQLLIAKPQIGFNIVLSQLVIYGVIIGLLLALSRILNIRYSDHAGIVFIAITKNESVAAAVAIMSIGVTAAVPAALIPAIQPVIAIAYVSILNHVRRILR